MTIDYSRELIVAKDIALKAGETMRKYFDIEKNIEMKADDSPVTIADKEINSFVIQELQKNFDDGIIGEEESTAEYGDGRRWICDPIDGTKAFIWGVPTSMFSLALVVDGSPVVGVTYDPFLNNLYEAQIGNGAFLNGQKIHVLEKTLQGEYVVVTSRPEELIERRLFIEELVKRGAKLAAYSGSVHKACYVARGRFVGYAEAGVNAHDVAATEIIVKEAGGMVTNFVGEKLDYRKPFKGAIFSNGIVHNDLVECAQKMP